MQASGFPPAWLQEAIPGVALSEHADGGRDVCLWRDVVEIQRLFEPLAHRLQALAFGDDGFELSGGVWSLEPLMPESQQLAGSLGGQVHQPRHSPPRLRIEPELHPDGIGRLRKHLHGLLQAVGLAVEDVGEPIEGIGGQFADPQLGDLRPGRVCRRQIGRGGDVRVYEVCRTCRLRRMQF